MHILADIKVACQIVLKTVNNQTVATAFFCRILNGMELYYRIVANSDANSIKTLIKTSPLLSKIVTLRSVLQHKMIQLFAIQLGILLIT